MADDIEKMIDAVDGTIPEEDVHKEEYVPVYKVFKESKIPVSKAVGKFWETRKNDAEALMRSNGDIDRWDESIAYYQNDQNQRVDKHGSLSETSTGRKSDDFYMTENIVFSNVSALVPSTYAKNPDIEMTATKEENEPKAKMYEKLLDTLFSRKVAPGLNIKPKMKKATVMALLTNLAYLDLSYIRKEDSSDSALEDLRKLSERLENEKTPKEIAAIEGELIALEEKVSLISPTGPRLRVRHPKMVIVDPHSEDADCLDANYMMVGEFVLTSYLNAVYGEKDEDGKFKSIYQPTHVINGTGEDGNDAEATINNFTLLDAEKDYKDYGFNSEMEFKASMRTLIWTVYDKSTRRVLLFQDKDWTWPIWVWDDPYKLTRFFPIFPLSYYTDPITRNARSEVTYYLDQQDEINKISQERARMRHWAMTKVLFDKSAIKDKADLERIMSRQTTDNFFGIDLPDGKKLTDMISAFPAPSTQMEQLFDTRPILESVSRMSSVTPTMQNVQFKTNTTNRAIESYESSTQLRLDEKIDAMEELLADVGMALLEMCVQFMTEEEVVDLIGADIVREAGGWGTDLTPEDLHREFNFKIVGGSTLKPTSKVKKEQAMQMGQVLGQFASSSPAVVLVMLKMFARAFDDDANITPSEWASIVQNVEQAIGQGQQKGGEEPQKMLEQLSQMLDQAPPNIKQQVGQAIAQGVPLQQVIAKFMEMAKQAPQAQQQPQPQQPPQQ
jgi:hypothetical protein